jgi:hypothetical protein
MDEKFYGVYAAMATLPGFGSAASKLNTLMQRVRTLNHKQNQNRTQTLFNFQVYAPILALASAHGLAVIDLPNTFDADNTQL